MKNISRVLICFIIAILLLSCEADSIINDEIDGLQVFNRPMLLRKLTSREYPNGSFSMSGDFFILLGNLEAKGQYSSELYIIFAWKYRGKYIMDRMKLTDIEIKFDNKIKTPTILFKRHEGLELWGIDCREKEKQIVRPYCYKGIRDFLRTARGVAIITCSPKDWPQEINMPLNKNHNIKRRAK